jgi:hypothetical protein
MRFVFKVCRVCEGKQNTVQIMRDPDTGEEWEQVIQCPYCKGKGTNYWGYMKADVELTDEERGLVIGTV